MPTISSTQSAQQQHVLVQAKAFKTPAEVMGVLVESAVYKSNLSVGQASVLGFLSGSMQHILVLSLFYLTSYRLISLCGLWWGSCIVC